MSAEGGEATRRTVLFTDLVGFTEFNELSGDAAAVEVLDAQGLLVERVLEQAEDSRLVKEIGDGLLLTFDRPAVGYPASHALLRAFRQAHDAGDLPLQVRMGLHHGDVAERGHDIVGRTVNVAARVMSLAGPGELLVSDDVARECPGASLRPIGPTQLRGVPEPVWLHRALLTEPVDRRASSARRSGAAAAGGAGRQPPLEAGS